MARRLFTFDFSKYRFLYDDVAHDFRVYKDDEDITSYVMNNPLLDLLLGYNNLYQKTVSDTKSLRRGIIRCDNVDVEMSVDKETNNIHYVIDGLNIDAITMLADDIFDYINDRVTYYMENQISEVK